MEKKSTADDSADAKLKVYESALRDASCQIEEKVRELSILRRVGDIAGHVFEIDFFYRSFVDVLIEEVRAMNCSFMAFDPVSDRLELKVARSRNDDGIIFDSPVKSRTIFALGEGVAGTVALTRETIFIPDTARDDRFKLRDAAVPIGTLICIPLVFNERLLGVVNISHPDKECFTESTKRLMEILCGFVSNIVGNAKVHIETQERFRSMFEGVPFTIIIIEPVSKKIIDCNHFTRVCFGFEPEELVAMRDVTDFVAEDYQPLFLRVLDETVARKQGEQDIGFHEMPFRTKDGDDKVCEVHAGMIAYLDREVIRLTLIDISEKKKLAEKLFQAEKLRSLGELAGGVAHDFNNVLAAILGRVQLLRMRRDSYTHPDGDEDPITINIDKNLDIIERAAMDGSETVRRIQDFARGHDEAKYQTPIDINAVLDDVLEFTRVKWKDMAESYGRAFTINRELEADEHILGNAPELREVYINLINNAIDAMPGGGSLTLKTYVEKGMVVSIVKDSGVGILDSHRDKIFDPFFTTKDVGSTGLGLSVSYGIIARHKGTIDVESRQGEGTTFVIRLPACGASAQDEAGENLLAPQKQCSILVVEDERNVGDTLSEILSFSGHKVSVAENGSEALQQFNDGDFDLVITDLGMPGLSGFEVAEKIKAINGSTPVILITGWGLQLNIQDLKERGVDYVINKPFASRQILNVIQEVLPGA